MKKIFFGLLLMGSFFKVNAQAAQPGTLFDFDWQFVKDIDTATSKAILSSKTDQTIKWESVMLPHTPRLESVIKTEEQWQGTCYYRKYFTLPVTDNGKHIAIQFDGAMNDADIFLNGKPVYKHIGGYLPFYIDLSAIIKFGQENCILVKLNNQDNPHIPPGKPIKDLDFNFYGGIYRDVWLIEKDKLHLSNAVQANHEAGGGVMLHYENVSQNTVKLFVKAEVQNDGTAQKKVQVILTLIGKDGQKVATGQSVILPVKHGSYTNFEQSMSINAPKLWSPRHPYLYRLQVDVLAGGKVVDSQTIRTGVKTFRFEPGAFYLNGEKLNLVGTNRHQEYPYIGYALSDNAQYRDAWKIKDAGLNFVRCSHYPPSPAFLDACDELGILVMDAIPGWQFFGDAVFQENSFQNIRDMLHRDRNHASIILWEASLNESRMDKPYMDKATHIVHAELPFKDVFSTGWIDYAYDVSNPARQHGKAPDYWKKYAKQKPLLLAEYGDWEYYSQNAGFNQKAYEGLKKEERSSRQLRTDGEDRMLQQALNFQEAHNDDLNGPNVGDAGWVMFDYKRGYAKDIESSGLMDIYRLPKFVYYFYQSQNGPKADDNGFGKPMIFIANYWNNPATKTVKIYSNCDEVELLLNGKTIARQHPDKDQYSNNLVHPPFTFAIDKYEAGKLEAVGYINGIKTVQTLRQTPGKPYAIKLSIDDSGKEFLASHSHDITFLRAAIIDENGTVVPDAVNEIVVSTELGAEKGIVMKSNKSIVSEAGIASMLLFEGPSSLKMTITATGKDLKSGSLILGAK